MDNELIANMRTRVAELRRVIGLAHDREMIAVIQKVIDDGEADIARLEAEGAQEQPGHEIPPPNQH